MQGAGFGIEGLEEAGGVEVVTGADEKMVADEDGRGSGEVLLLEVDDLTMPTPFAGFGVEGDELIVGSLEV